MCLRLSIPQGTVVGLDNIYLGVEFFDLPDDLSGLSQFVTSRESIGICVVIGHRMVVYLVTNVDYSVGAVFLFDR